MTLTTFSSVRLTLGLLQRQVLLADFTIQAKIRVDPFVYSFESSLAWTVFPSVTWRRRLHQGWADVRFEQTRTGNMQRVHQRAAIQTVPPNGRAPCWSRMRVVHSMTAHW